MLYDELYESNWLGFKASVGAENALWFRIIQVNSMAIVVGEFT